MREVRYCEVAHFHFLYNLIISQHTEPSFDSSDRNVGCAMKMVEVS
jgi:hypothetical protein